jgi:glycerol-3-phosphate dehydrogenase
LVLDFPATSAFLVEVPDEERLCFILPYRGKTLVGSTEVRQGLTEPIECSDEEQAYLLRTFRYYLETGAAEVKVLHKFAGLRPLVRSDDNPSRATREYAIEKSGQVINVFGGKWTTSRVLGENVANMADNILREMGAGTSNGVH